MFEVKDHDMTTEEVIDIDRHLVPLIKYLECSLYHISY